MRNVWARVLGTVAVALTVSAIVSCDPVPTATPDASSATTSATSSPSNTAIPTPEFGTTTIAVIGDFGSGDSNEQAVADLVSGVRPAAVVTVGDNVYSDAGYQALVGDFYQPFISATTFYPATGNHDHIYERIVLDGMTYVVDGSGGKSLYQCAEPRVDGSLTCDDSNYGALFLTASSTDLRGRFIASDGTLVDEFAVLVTR